MRTPRGGWPRRRPGSHLGPGRPGPTAERPPAARSELGADVPYARGPCGLEATSTTTCRAEAIAQRPLEPRTRPGCSSTGARRARPSTAGRATCPTSSAPATSGGQRHAGAAGPAPPAASRRAARSRCSCSSRWTTSSAVGGAGPPGRAAAARGAPGSRPDGRRRRGRSADLGDGVDVRWSAAPTTRWRRSSAVRRGAAAAVHHDAARRPRALPDRLRRRPGSVAAPTAGLHLTDRLLDALAAARASRSPRVELAVGLDTFQPVTVDDLDDHRMHSERYRVPAEDAGGRAATAGGGSSPSAPPPCGRWRAPRDRRAARGAPTCSSAARSDWQVVDVLLTNFHLPRTTLLDADRRLRRAPLARPLRQRRSTRATASCPSATPCSRRSGDAVTHRCASRSRRADGAARRRRGDDRRAGAYRTPCFMPVGTRGAVKHLSARRPRATSASRSCSATPTTSCCGPAPTSVAALGGLDGFTGWDGPRPHRLRRLPGVLARAASRRRRRHVPLHLRRLDAPAHPRAGGRDPGAARRRHPDGARRLPAAAVAAATVVRVAVERTAAWAKRARAGPPPRRPGAVRHRAGWHRRRPCGPRAPARTVELDFDGYGIGGLSVGETRAEMLPALAAALAELPADRPRYLMGVGDPASLVEAVGLGVDQFDCVMPTRLGRHGTALTADGAGCSSERRPRPRRRAPRRRLRLRACARRSAAATCATCSRSASPARPGCSRCTTWPGRFALMDRLRAAIAAGRSTTLRAGGAGHLGVTVTPAGR